MDKYRVVDLFAGAGGLSLGFEQTNQYEIKVAFENSPYMQETYRRNHPNVDVRGDVCAADYDEIQSEYGPIDIVIGGPPCQGFSNANRQKNTAISKNNMLVKQYIRAIVELQPKAFVMENVSMLRSEVHRFYLDKKDEPLLKRYQIPVKETKLKLLDEDLMFQQVLEYTSDISMVKDEIWEDAAYAKLNIVYKASRNTPKLISTLKKHEKALKKYADSIIDGAKETFISLASAKAFRAVTFYYDGVLPAEELKSYIEPAIMYQRMLARLIEIKDNDLVVDRWETGNGLTAVIRSYAVYDYLKAILSADPNGYSICASVLCAADYGAPQKRMRFVVMGIKKKISESVVLPQGKFLPENYRTVRDAISDLAEIPVVTDLADDVGIEISDLENISELGKELRNSSILRNHLATKTREVAMERFRAIKPGQNFHSLDDSLKTNTYTDISRTQNTIYLRLNYDEPSGPVVNVRKSMWIHPELDRAISIREAARLQTFPDSFVFCGSKDKQYQQVGNAVPPIMAKAIAEELARQLNHALEGNE